MNTETLHLIKGYLGYEVMCEIEESEGFGDYSTCRMELFEGLSYCSQFEESIESIKPILRHIEDLTDDEIKQLWYVMPSYLDNVNYKKEKTLEHLWNNIQSLDYRTMEYLNSIHIDYFGLIGQGLAIKKGN